MIVSDPCGHFVVHSSICLEGSSKPIRPLCCRTLCVFCDVFLLFGWDGHCPLTHCWSCSLLGGGADEEEEEEEVEKERVV